MAQKGCSQQPPPKRGDPGAFFSTRLLFLLYFVCTRPLPPPPPELWERVGAGWGSFTSQTITQRTNQVGCSRTGESYPRGCRTSNRDGH